MKFKKSTIIKKGIRTIALLVIVTFLITIYTPISAEATALKEEVVYVRLNNDGSLSQVYVVNSFQLGQENEILDYGNYEYVQNLTDNREIKLEDGKVTVDAKGDQLYYEGFLASPQLPWNISIRYILDGQEVSPDDIPGKTGHLNIEIETDANPLGSMDFFDSYALQIALTLDSSICRNISAEGATIALAGGSKQVNYVVLPGKNAMLELSADVENFEMPAITIGGVRLNMDFDFEDYDMSEINQLTDGIAELDEGVKELIDGIFDMKKGVSGLHDGTIGLRDGVGEFKDGTKELSKGTGELKDGVSGLKDGTIEMADGALELVEGTTGLVDGVRELNSGVGEFADGIDELYSGIRELLKGTEELYSGMDEITGGSKDLKSGADKLASGVAEAAAGGAELAGGFSKYYGAIIALVDAQLAGTGIPGLTFGDISNVSPTMLEGALLENAILQARQTISNEVKGAARQQILETILRQLPSPMTSVEYNNLPEENEIKANIEMIVNAQLSSAEMQEGLNYNIEAILDMQMPAIQEQVIKASAEVQQLLEMLKGYNQLMSGLVEYVGGIQIISSGVDGYSTGIGEFNDGLNEFKSGLSEYQSGMSQFYEKSHELVDGANELEDGTMELLNGAIEFQNGVVEFKDGVVELRDGVIKLFDGIVELHNGVIEMSDGAIELHDGVIKLTDGTGKLKNGISDLYDGVAELKDGTGKFHRETKNIGTDISNVIKEEINKMMGANAPVKSYTSDKNGEISTVQFVMQTEGISIPEMESEVVKSEPESELTFWQRFLNLFGF